MDLSDIVANRHELVQLKESEVKFIVKTLQKIVPCNFLVFGMGYDTSMWNDCNKKGRTVFLENCEDWYNNINDMVPSVESYLVEYKTDLLNWKETLNKPELLELDLPESVLNTEWDVILVDSPVGKRFKKYVELYGEPPGRMSSIYMAHKLLKKKGIAFIHDYNREVERKSAMQIFGPRNYVNGKRLVAQYIKRKQK